MTGPTLTAKWNMRSGNLRPERGEVASHPPMASRASADVENILIRMKAGDRQAAALFITHYGSRVRRRVRGKLGPAMRRLFDSEEILSTVGRRLDLYVRNGKLEAAGESQLWKLIFQMADCAVLQKANMFQRLERVEASDSDVANHLLQRLHRADSEPDGADRVIDQALVILTNETDRQILSLWLGGQDHAAIGEQLGLTPAAVRKRWQAIKEKLRAHLAVDQE